jgi:hypothetical protein
LVEAGFARSNLRRGKSSRSPASSADHVPVRHAVPLVPGSPAAAALALGFVGLALTRPPGPRHIPALPDSARHRGVCFVAGPFAPTDADFADLAAHGVTWISQTPFGWQARPDEPAFRMITDGRIYWARTRPGGHRAWRARRHPDDACRTCGIARVAGRHRHEDEPTGPRFARYEEFIVHYAAGRARAWRRCASALKGDPPRGRLLRIVAVPRLPWPAGLRRELGGEFERRLWTRPTTSGAGLLPAGGHPSLRSTELPPAGRRTSRISAVARTEAGDLTEIGYKASDCDGRAVDVTTTDR